MNATDNNCQWYRAQDGGSSDTSTIEHPAAMVSSWHIEMAKPLAVGTSCCGLVLQRILASVVCVMAVLRHCQPFVLQWRTGACHGAPGPYGIKRAAQCAMAMQSSARPYELRIGKNPCDASTVYRAAGSKSPSRCHWLSGSCGTRSAISRTRGIIPLLDCFDFRQECRHTLS